jgi:RNA polymerase sigma factor for flagellar operon FliA
LGRNPNLLRVTKHASRSGVFSTMPERQDYAALLVAHLGWIERVAAALCRRHALDPDEADDFASWAKARLVEDDYAVLRKFRGESALTTYLTVVLNMFYRDYRVSRWGRWRPSAAARRRGPLAMKVETLVYRDGYHWSQAAALLQQRGEANLSDREVAALLAQLPSGTRGRPMEVGAEPLATAPARTQADDTLLAGEAQAEREATRAALQRAMAGLDDEDRRIVEMRFWKGATVADIARVLGLDQKPLYRRLERIFRHLRTNLEAQGISADQVRELIEDDT